MCEKENKKKGKEIKVTAQRKLNYHWRKKGLEMKKQKQKKQKEGKGQTWKITPKQRNKIATNKRREARLELSWNKKKGENK